MSGALTGDFLSQGVLVFEQLPLKDRELELIKAGGADIEKIHFGRSAFLQVSPESGSITWVAENNTDLVIRTQEGRLLEYPNAVTNYGFPRQWLGGDRLLLRHSLERPETEGEEMQAYYRAADDFYVLDPGDPEPQHYQIAMDGFFSVEFGPPFRAALAYDPGLTRVIYGWESEYNQANSSSGLILWDIENSSVVWKHLGMAYLPVKVDTEWQRDGSQVVFSAPVEPDDPVHELFSVTRDGKETQLTYLSQVYSRYYEISRTHWSPDGRRVAFVIVKDASSHNAQTMNRYLYVLDTQTGVVTDHCLPNPAWDMVWSPDSRQIAFHVFASDGSIQWLGVMDFESLTYRKLDQVFEVYGWAEND